MTRFSRFCTSLVAFSLGVGSAFCQQRVPATPLIAHDPYFSIWSTTDKLTDSDTTHWTGSPQPLIGLVRIDGHTMRFMGKHPESVPAIQQVSSSITATHPRYEFQNSGVSIKIGRA